MRSSDAYGSDPSIFEKRGIRGYRHKEPFTLPSNVIDTAAKLDPSKYYIVGSLNQSANTTVTSPSFGGQSCGTQKPSQVYIEYNPTSTDHAICSTGTLDIYSDPGMSEVSCILTDNAKNYYRYFQKKPDTTLDAMKTDGGATIRKAQYGGRTCSQQFMYYPTSLDTRTIGTGAASLGFCTPFHAVCNTGDSVLYTVDKSSSESKCNYNVRDINIISAYYSRTNYSGRNVTTIVQTAWDNYAKHITRDWTFLANTDFPYGDIAYKDVPFSQCAAECRALSGCGGYTVQKNRGSGCWFKTHSVFSLQGANGSFNSNMTTNNNRDSYFYPAAFNYTLSINPTTMGGDPFPGTRKFLFVNYRIGLDQTLYTTTGADTEVLTFNPILDQMELVNREMCSSCVYPALNDIIIVDANYGSSYRTGLTITPFFQEKWNQYKVNPNTTFLVNNTTFGSDPAPGATKRVFVTYKTSLNGSTYTTSSPEGFSFDFSQMIQTLDRDNNNIRYKPLYKVPVTTLESSAITISQAMFNGKTCTQQIVAPMSSTIDPKACDSFSSSSTGVSVKCIQKIWSDVGCNNAAYIPDNYSGQWRRQTLAAIRQDMSTWASSSAADRKQACYTDYPEWKLVGTSTTAPSYCPPTNAQCSTSLTNLYINPGAPVGLDDVTIVSANYGTSTNFLSALDYVRNSWNAFKYCQQQLVSGLRWVQVPLQSKFLALSSLGSWPDAPVSIFGKTMTVIDRSNNIWVTSDFTSSNPAWISRDGKGWNIDLSSPTQCWVRGTDIRPYRSDNITVSGNWWLPCGSCVNNYQTVAKDWYHYELENNNNGDGGLTFWCAMDNNNWYRDGRHFPNTPYRCLAMDKDPGTYGRGVYVDGRRSLIFIRDFDASQWVDRSIKGTFNRVSMFNYACAMIGIDRNVYYTPDIRSDEKAFLIAYGPAVNVSINQDASGNPVVAFARDDGQIFYTVIPSWVGNDPIFFPDPAPGVTKQLTVVYTIGKSAKQYSFTSPDYNNIDTMYWNIPLMVQTRATDGTKTYTLNDIVIQSAWYYPVNLKGRDVTTILQGYWNTYKANPASVFSINNTSMGGDPLSGNQKKLYINFKVGDYPVVFVDQSATDTTTNYNFWYLVTTINYLNNTTLCTQSTTDNLYYRPWQSISPILQDSSPLTTSFPVNNGAFCSTLNPLQATSLLNSGSTSPSYCPPVPAKCLNVVDSNTGTNYSYTPTAIIGSMIPR